MDARRAPASAGLGAVANQPAMPHTAGSGPEAGLVLPQGRGEALNAVRNEGCYVHGVRKQCGACAPPRIPGLGETGVDFPTDGFERQVTHIPNQTVARLLLVAGCARLPAAEPAPAAIPRAPVPAEDASREERVRMTRLRATIAAWEFEHGQPVTVSVGLSQFLAGDDAHTLLQRADRALYRAKEGGRNRTEALFVAVAP